MPAHGKRSRPSAREADRRARRIRGCAHLAIVMCRFPSRSLTSGVVTSPHRTGTAHRCLVHWRFHDYCHHDPAHPRAAHRVFCAGESALTGMSLCMDGASPPPIQGRIDDEIHASASWDTGVDDQQEEAMTHSDRRPSRSSENLVTQTPGGRTLVATGTLRRSDRSASVGQKRSRSHDHPFLPCRSGKTWPKGRSKGHVSPPESERAVISFSLPSRGRHAWFFSPQWTTSSLKESCLPFRSCPLARYVWIIC
jgi:hypothetical protein